MARQSERENEKRINARKAGRAAAVEIIEAGLLALPVGHGADFAEAFIERITELLPQRRKPEPEKETSMSIAGLGATKLKCLDREYYHGWTFDDAPLDYLDRLCAAQEELTKALRAYLTHPELEGRRRGA